MNSRRVGDMEGLLTIGWKMAAAEHCAVLAR